MYSLLLWIYWYDIIACDKKAVGNVCPNLQSCFITNSAQKRNEVCCEVHPTNHIQKVFDALKMGTPSASLTNWIKVILSIINLSSTFEFLHQKDCVLCVLKKLVIYVYVDSCNTILTIKFRNIMHVSKARSSICWFKMKDIWIVFIRLLCILNGDCSSFKTFIRSS